MTLFRTGPARRTSGSFTVSYSGADGIVKRLQKLKDGGEVAIKRTVSDFTSRGPGWVSKGIREHYGVDTAAIKDAAKKPKRGKTSIRVAGISVDGATLEYKGRTLTPTHCQNESQSSAFCTAKEADQNTGPADSRGLSCCYGKAAQKVHREGDNHKRAAYSYEQRHLPDRWQRRGCPSPTNAPERAALLSRQCAPCQCRR